MAAVGFVCCSYSHFGGGPSVSKAILGRQGGGPGHYLIRLPRHPPALLATILSLMRKCWLLLVPGIWFTGIGVLGRYLDSSDGVATILVLCGLVLVFTPILAVVPRREM